MSKDYEVLDAYPDYSGWWHVKIWYRGEIAFGFGKTVDRAVEDAKQRDEQ